MPGKVIIHAPLQRFDFRCDRTVLQPEQNTKPFLRRDEIALHLIERGRFRVVFATGDHVELDPHRLMVSWGAIPHRAEWLHKDTIVLCLSIPLAWVLRWQLPSLFTSELLAGRVLTEPDTTNGVDDQHMLFRWVELLKHHDDESRRIVLLEAEARLRRLAKTYQTATRPITSTHSSKIEQAIQLIAKRFAEPLTVPVLAEELRVHPNYLSTLFKRETGQTLSRYLAEYRLAHACGLLVTTTSKIIDVAYAAGFGSLSQFHTLFQRYRGCSPRQYRLTHRPHASP